MSNETEKLNTSDQNNQNNPTQDNKETSLSPKTNEDGKGNTNNNVVKENKENVKDNNNNITENKVNTSNNTTPTKEENNDKKEENKVDENKQDSSDDNMGDDNVETNRELTNEEKQRLQNIRQMEFIEKEFASLKDNYFTEKIDSLQKELQLVGAGTHLKYLEKLKELVEKRDKEIELANRWKAYQIQNINTVFIQKKVQADQELNFAKKQLENEIKQEINEKKKKVQEEKTSTTIIQTNNNQSKQPSKQTTVRNTRKRISSEAKKQSSNSRRKLNPSHISYTLSPAEITEDLNIIQKGSLSKKDFMKILNDIYVENNEKLCYYSTIFKLGDGILVSDSSFEPLYKGAISKISPNEIRIKVDHIFSKKDPKTTQPNNTNNTTNITHNDNNPSNNVNVTNQFEIMTINDLKKIKFFLSVP